MKPFSSTSFPYIACTPLLVALAVLGLSACAEEESADLEAGRLDAAGPDTALAGHRGGLQTDSVTVQSTIGLLRQDVQEIAVNQAVRNLNGWQQRLQGPQWADLRDQLAGLQEELLSEQINPDSVGTRLIALGNRTSEAAAGLQSPTATKLDQLARLLTQIGQRLTDAGQEE